MAKPLLSRNIFLVPALKPSTRTTVKERKDNSKLNTLGRLVSHRKPCLRRGQHPHNPWYSESGFSLETWGFTLQKHLCWFITLALAASIIIIYTNGQLLTHWHPLQHWQLMTVGKWFQTTYIPQKTLQYWGDGAKHILQVPGHTCQRLRTSSKLIGGNNLCCTHRDNLGTRKRVMS